MSATVSEGSRFAPKTVPRRLSRPKRPTACRRGRRLKEMLRKFRAAIIVVGLAAAALALDTPAQAEGLQVGVLTCNVASGFGFVFGSSRAVNCTFSRRGGPPEHYVGAIN